MPEAVRVPVPGENAAANTGNFSVGNRGRNAVVLHLTAGTAASAKARFQNPAQRVSSHFLALKSGAIWQFVSVLDTAYANGLSWSASPKCWKDPEGNLLRPPHAPTWQGLTPPINPNFQTISVERELASTSDIPPIPQNDAVVRILQYVHSLFPTAFASWVPLHTLIGHCHISPIARANCPGPKCDYQALASAANVPPPPPSPLPVKQTYRVKGTPIYQAQNLLGPTAGFLLPGDVIEVDVLYEDSVGHLKSGLGFIDMKCCEVNA